MKAEVFDYSLKVNNTYNSDILKANLLYLSSQKMSSVFSPNPPVIIQFILNLAKAQKSGNCIYSRCDIRASKNTGRGIFYAGKLSHRLYIQLSDFVRCFTNELNSYLKTYSGFF